MCGIFASVARRKALEPDNTAKEILQARGPDSLRTIQVSIPRGSPQEPYILTLCSSVLALRGDNIEEQPLVDPSTGTILCWNGEAWKRNKQQVRGNDSVVVFNLLLVAAASESPSVSIVEALTSIAGPFAFVFYDARSSSIYYGRDRLGRRSLVIQQNGEGSLTISSVSASTSNTPGEVTTDGLHRMSFGDHHYQLRGIQWPVPSHGINVNHPTNSLLPVPSAETADFLLDQLRESLKLRVLNIPNHSTLHIHPGSARIAILFSGGLDCTLLARIVHDILPLDSSIDLLNVAFENPRAMKNRATNESPYEICPDRITGRTTFAELLQTCPDRTWRFVSIDIPYTETLTHQPTILHLLKPHNTEMDLSIGMALYFAARGYGTTSSPHNPEPQLYNTTARVLLSGLGADELFGGYTRHAKAFQRGSYTGLIDELSLDFNRIGQRNLGRDDRVISHWGREVRYPYLDEDFVDFALGLPIWEKCGFREGRELPKHYEDATKAERIEDLDPSKMLLRMVLWKLGMKGATAERKRAIQFGAKTAKMEVGGGRRRGTDAVEE